MLSKAFLAAGALLAAFSSPAISAETKTIEIWRSASVDTDRGMLDVLKRAVAAKGYDWKETVADRPDVVAALSKAEPIPTGALLNGFDVLGLAAAGKVGDISATARKDGWDRNVPDSLLRFLEVDGRWIAAPIDIIPVNGLFINAGLMDKIGGLEPKSMDDLFALLDRAKDSGVNPLTIGDDPRDQASLFDLVVVATAGVDFYKRVFVDIRESDIKSDNMKRAFDNLARLRDYVDAADAHRDNQAATLAVVKGEALAHAGASPTKLAFSAAGQIAGKDFRCYRFPGTEDSLLYGLDLIAMPKVEASQRAAQSALAEAVMDPQVQIDASRAKATVAARGGLEDPDADACQSLDYFSVEGALASGRFYGSMTDGYMQPPAIAKAYIDVVARFYRGEIKTSEDAQAALWDALSPPK
jgi:glucose/mannose transport system substrate-binding protein